MCDCGIFLSIRSSLYSPTSSAHAPEPEVHLYCKVIKYKGKYSFAVSRSVQRIPLKHFWRAFVHPSGGGLKSGGSLSNTNIKPQPIPLLIGVLLWISSSDIVVIYTRYTINCRPRRAATWIVWIQWILTYSPLMSSCQRPSLAGWIGLDIKSRWPPLSPLSVTFLDRPANVTILTLHILLQRGEHAQITNSYGVMQTTRECYSDFTWVTLRLPRSSANFSVSSVCVSSRVRVWSWATWPDLNKMTMNATATAERSHSAKLKPPPEGWTKARQKCLRDIHSFCSQWQIPTEVHWLGGYHLPRTRTKFGERGFFYSRPAALNTLPSDLHDIADICTFRKRLKNVLYDCAYNWLFLAILDVSYSGAL